MTFTGFHYLALPRFNLRSIRTSDVSPGKELLVPILLGDDDLDMLASPIDATIKHIVLCSIYMRVVTLLPFQTTLKICVKEQIPLKLTYNSDLNTYNSINQDLTFSTENDIFSSFSRGY